MRDEGRPGGECVTKVELEVNADEGRSGGKATRRHCD